ncbi:UNKNOWN [Stylonychia lemnae]|uniref:VWFA domain-containing protein n=1 Tax=Stylonychia lemnae TaxID=5949 RepID=A0A078B5W4_STYLE|nr:UNKNOWN [Stylonychia lemnae]|eukprot:CDW89621.1 UNKNOWN [Stylonychia lemnae]
MSVTKVYGLLMITNKGELTKAKQIKKEHLSMKTSCKFTLNRLKDNRLKLLLMQLFLKNYDQVQVSSDGIHIFLKCKNSIDIYDLNWNQIHNFDLDEDFCFYKMFPFESDHYITIFYKSRTECFQITGNRIQTIIRSEISRDTKNQVKGNPIIDKLYQGFLKFGPHSDFIGCPSSTNLAVCIQSNIVKKDMLKKYIDNLRIYTVQYEIFNSGQIKSLDFIKSRVPIHLATIENFNLMPLSNGVNITEEILNFIENSPKNDQLKSIIQLINIGIYEQFLNNVKSDIKVISIVGKQSSGKSYGMNRFFGTRFGVAANRCTDGIWMSIVEVLNDEGQPKLFVVLDCEDKKRWINGRDFVESLKIVLLQVLLDDDTSMDMHKTRINVENVYQTSIQLFQNGDDKVFDKEALDIELIKIGEINFNVEVNQKILVLNQTIDIKERNQEYPKYSNQLQEEFEKNTTSYSIIKHNDWKVKTNVYKFMGTKAVTDAVKVIINVLLNVKFKMDAIHYAQWRLIIINIHICESECVEEGVCIVSFQQQEKIWKSGSREFPYIFYLPLIQRLQCKLPIEKYDRQHQQSHNCLAEYHRCDAQCPECKSFCKETVNHSGNHRSNAHRNKENCIFLSNKNYERIQIKTQDGVREFRAGESCEPDTCYSSCSRRGRAHYHLKKCLGENQCMALSNPNAQHSSETYYPFENEVYDKWLCKQYWEQMGWDAPIEGNLKEEFQLCRFFCSHKSHKGTPEYCIKKAWHQEDHKFNCGPHQKEITNMVDIVFCQDTTGSMKSYLEQSKSTVKKIIEEFKQKVSSIGYQKLRFGFVAYRDHLPHDTTYVTKIHPLDEESKIIDFIGTLTAEGGGGDGPEAVMDGLYDSIHSVNWRQDSLRFIFHIGDAPPHGREYHTAMRNFLKIITLGLRSLDNYPDGCPCLIRIDDIAHYMLEKQIKYKFLKLSSDTNIMVQIFKSKINGMEVIEVDEPLQLDLKVSGAIIREIINNDQDIIFENEEDL